MAIERTDVGAWLLKGDPAQWDYWAERANRQLGPGDLVSASWSLGSTYRNSLIRDGDLVVLYIGGRQSPGIVEIGRINDERFTGTWSAQFTVDQSQRSKIREFVTYDGVLLHSVVQRSTMKIDRGLAHAEVIRASQLTNPSYLTPDELSALKAHMTHDELRAAKWDRAD